MTTFDISRVREFEKWLDEIGMPKDKKSPARIVEFKDDPIALSWASYAVWKKFPARRWVDLKEVEAFPHDREMAEATRKYYRDRYTMDALKGKQLTQFQTTLYGIVGGENPILSDQIGILMKIPYFYVEDTTLDAIFSENKSVRRDSVIAENFEDTITPLAYTFASRKSHEMHQYWFTDSKGHTTLWSVAASNPLGSVVRSLHNRKEPIRIRANWHHARQRGNRYDHTHWNLSAVELI
jgi:hypothetical protein